MWMESCRKPPLKMFPIAEILEQSQAVVELARQISNCLQSLTSSSQWLLLAFWFWLAVAVVPCGCSLMEKCSWRGLAVIGRLGKSVRKTLSNDYSYPSKTARCVVVACLPYASTSCKQGRGWCRKCGFAATGLLVLCGDLRGKPEWRTVMSSSAGGKQ